MKIISKDLEAYIHSDFVYFNRTDFLCDFEFKEGSFNILSSDNKPNFSFNTIHDTYRFTRLYISGVKLPLYE